MPYINVSNDISKTKIAFNLTKRQLVCFGIGVAVGISAYLLSRRVSSVTLDRGVCPTDDTLCGDAPRRHLLPRRALYENGGI